MCKRSSHLPPAGVPRTESRGTVDKTLNPVCRTKVGFSQNKVYAYGESGATCYPTMGWVPTYISHVCYRFTLRYHYKPPWSHISSEVTAYFTPHTIQRDHGKRYGKYSNKRCTIALHTPHLDDQVILTC